MAKGTVIDVTGRSTDKCNLDSIKLRPDDPNTYHVRYFPSPFQDNRRFTLTNDNGFRCVSHADVCEEVIAELQTCYDRATDPPIKPPEVTYMSLRNSSVLDEATVTKARRILSGHGCSEILLTERARTDGNLELLVQCYSGSHQGPLRMMCAPIDLDQDMSVFNALDKCAPR